MVLTNSVLEAIPVYWNLLTSIPKGILNKIHKIYCNYLWKVSVEYLGSHLLNWKQVVTPESQGGWGLKNIHMFGKALVAKSRWFFISRNNLWSRILEAKYVASGLTIDRIRCRNKSTLNASN